MDDPKHNPARTDLCPRMCKPTEESGKTTSLQGCMQCVEAWREAGGTFEEVTPESLIKPCSRSK